MNGPGIWGSVAKTTRYRHGARALLIMTALVACAVYGQGEVSAARTHMGGTATFALPAATVPNYIFPMTPGGFADDANLEDFGYQLYRPLYWFGNKGTPNISYHYSIGRAPVFSNGGKTVTIMLNSYSWSDGAPVTNRDIEFWMNLLIATKANWIGYVPGAFPDNVVSMSFPSGTPRQFSLTFNRAYNRTWLLYNELSQIIPLPQQAWDRESLQQTDGNYDTTTSGAEKVYAFLDAQSRILTTWVTSPLWKVVDGPWRLEAYSTSTGYTALVPNKHYTGPNPAHLAKVELVPFTSSAAEFDALRSGQLDYGYIPTEDVSQRSYFTRKGYTFDAWTDWAINFFWGNYTNPVAGPILRQLYVRQALQHLTDQAQYVKDLLHGYGYPTYGPVPVEPANDYVTAAESKNPYPYDPKTAKTLLTEHGWRVHPDGTTACVRSGTGANECGSGIAKGAALKFTMVYASGSATFTSMMEALKSDWSAAGIQLGLSQLPYDETIDAAFSCVPATGVGCSWDFVNWGTPGFSWSYAPDYDPTGEDLFKAGAGGNAGDFTDATLNQDILATQFKQGSAVFGKYEAEAVKLLPVVWLPTFPYQLSEVSGKLHGVLPQDPNVNIYPQNWYFAS